MKILKRKKGTRLQILEKYLNTLFMFDEQIAYIESIETGVVIKTYKQRINWFYSKNQKYASIYPKLVKIRIADTLGIEGEPYVLNGEYDIYLLGSTIASRRNEFLQLKKDFSILFNIINKEEFNFLK